MRDKEGEHFLPVYLQALLKLSRLPDTKSRTKPIGKVSDNIGRRNPYLMQLFLPVIKFNLSHLPCPSSSSSIRAAGYLHALGAILYIHWVLSFRI